MNQRGQKKMGKEGHALYSLCARCCCMGQGHHFGNRLRTSCPNKELQGNVKESKETIETVSLVECWQ